MARELGLDAVPAKVEPVRGKLRKLAERGWITRTPAGRYLPRWPAADCHNGRFGPQRKRPRRVVGPCVNKKTSPAEGDTGLVHTPSACRCPARPSTAWPT
ncbi:hypothetical protein SGFS_008260 [Streptomyces graminofaciens]|uniref:Uncharacterized protein n=1 Tax=Streptomyces graminofaciens TaxID=68212 RepID=A0ABN5V8C7_9ACTN|nr:hypothetical protein SGFS_008260 [Streptomyces graminofaciens]